LEPQITQIDADWERDTRRRGTTDSHGWTRIGKGLSSSAALTGRCRSGGSVDTLTGKLIRLSGCQPIHVRVADSTACHSSHLISPIKSALIGVNLRFHSLSQFLYIRVHQCSSVVHSLLLLLRVPLWPIIRNLWRQRGSHRQCGSHLWFHSLIFLAFLGGLN
jgi:hypothetical protein